MFPAPTSLAGCIVPGTTLSDPADDAQLLSESESHFWVEFDPGTGLVAADPDFSSAAIGQTFAAATATFGAVPDELHQKVEITVQAEMTSTAIVAGAVCVAAVRLDGARRDLRRRRPGGRPDHL